MKPKPKFKTGPISESTTSLKVDQSNSSICIIDPKTAVSGQPVVQQSTPLAPSLNTMKVASGQEPPTTTLNSMVENGVTSGSSVVPSVAATNKKEGGLAKAQVDKKKIDARKKSLKRL